MTLFFRSSVALNLLGAARPLSAMLLASAIVAAAPPLWASETCHGDCDSDGVVEIAELLLAVNIALEREPVAACPEYACSLPECVPVVLILRSVGNALRGCPATPTLTEPAPSPSFTRTPTVTRTPDPDPVVAALDRVVDAKCTWDSPGPFLRGAYARENGYRIYCDAATGHDSDADLLLYPSSSAAAEAFADKSQPGALVAFHDLPAAYWQIPFNGDGANRYLVWQLGCWLVNAHNFDDTHFAISSHPIPFSEAILAEAGELLLANCERGT
ncbi:hypothetical protein KF840_19890 [bacterium]|nr:hypothetical protein [bacterium]